MTETHLFVSSCSKREMARRRGHRSRPSLLNRVGPVALVLIAFGVVCCGAFIAGHGGI
jgi:hypothetical protein